MSKLYSNAVSILYSSAVSIVYSNAVSILYSSVVSIVYSTAVQVTIHCTALHSTAVRDNAVDCQFLLVQPHRDKGRKRAEK